MENSTQRWTQSRPFFPRSGHCFGFSKRAGEVSFNSLNCVPVGVAGYTSIAPNMPKCSLKCLKSSSD